jgi:DNA uptake protein ComE-like DNA-binding protein
MGDRNKANMNMTSVRPEQWRGTRSALLALVAMAASGLCAAAGGGTASAPAPAGQASAAAKQGAPAQPVKLVDINSASAKELKTLPGIGDAEAARIIAGRPYLTKADLVTKNALATGPYLSLKDRVVALQKTPPKSKTADKTAGTADGKTSAKN